MCLCKCYCKIQVTTIEMVSKVNHEAKGKTESECVIFELKNILDELRECMIIVLLLHFTYHPVLHFGFLHPLLQFMYMINISN